MEQYRVYLRSELGKLRSVEEARAFLARSGCRMQTFNLRSEAEWLAGAFASQAQVEIYVDSLDVEESCPSELRGWLGKALRGGNHFTFAERLRALLDENSWLQGDVIDDPSRFVREVTDTRNYHTHLDETSSPLAADGLGVWQLAERLAVLLEACLLHELGLPSEEAANRIVRASRHYSAIKLNPGLR